MPKFLGLPPHKACAIWAWVQTQDMGEGKPGFSSLLPEVHMNLALRA